MKHRVVLCFSDLKTAHLTCHQKCQELLKGIAGRFRWLAGLAGLVHVLRLFAASRKCLESMLILILGKGEIMARDIYQRVMRLLCLYPVTSQPSLLSRRELPCWAQYVWKDSRNPRGFFSSLSSACALSLIGLSST